jgi:hypothetical protein
LQKPEGFSHRKDETANKKLIEVEVNVLHKEMRISRKIQF